MTPQKSRLLFLLELLNRETDEEHPTTIAEIIDRLNTEGFSANRHTVAGDINTLMAHGVDIVCNKSRQNQYFIGDRHFELPELTLLVDAVQAARFISAKQSKALIAKLSSLASVHQADKLNRQLYVDKQPKAVNESVLYTVDLIHSAIHSKKQITFQYVEYTAAKRKSLKHGGQIYRFSPYALLWKNDSYYVLGYSENHGKVVKFRVDRMAKPESAETKAVRKPKDFRVETYAKSVFQMFDEESHMVTLRCKNSLMKSIIDQFGEKVKTAIADDDHFIAEVEVSVSPTFFGWIVGFGGKVEIVTPECVLEKYTRTLKGILEKPHK
ncbi:MAG: WYL domain-containing protein [Eubacteriales bacterium]|nr:WYL domain-containing protein [Eubacteriales bacterium]